MKILRLLKRGLDSKTIAAELCIKRRILYNINVSICEKLHVDTIEQAIVYAANHLMLFDTTHETSSKNKCEISCERHQKLTREKLERIQDCLNKGQSIRSTARDEGVSERGVLKAVKTGKLVKNQGLKT
jgi:DNA-binding CsgD family transcriptional regulator